MIAPIVGGFIAFVSLEYIDGSNNSKLGIDKKNTDPLELKDDLIFETHDQDIIDGKDRNRFTGTKSCYEIEMDRLESSLTGNIH